MIEQAQTAHSVLVLAESYSVHENLFRARSEQYGPGARRRVALASTVPASAYLKAARVRKVFQDEFRKAMDGTDVLLTLTSPAPPARFGEQPAHQFGARHMGKAGNRFTRMANLLGAPAVSVPCGFTSSGLPIGLQVVGRPGDDTTVLTVAQAYQQRTTWHTQAPPTAAVI